ncbi:hypothetical protein NTH_00564 [Nitratireductor thuwali]|uniref:Uncharacterized protein n=2 Tax=Nitratireductor thuwali TaxID=2267699 RepID=A0ABY5MH96_9HYPH|nr:hypothetical protein NTH_00564 [Nitratireductor thuwali]
MKLVIDPRLAEYAKIAAAVTSLAALGGLGLAMWLNNGPAMVISLAQAGLAWCF